MLVDRPDPRSAMRGLGPERASCAGQRKAGADKSCSIRVISVISGLASYSVRGNLVGGTVPWGLCSFQIPCNTVPWGPCHPSFRMGQSIQPTVFRANPRRRFRAIVRKTRLSDPPAGPTVGDDGRCHLSASARVTASAAGKYGDTMCAPGQRPEDAGYL